MSGSRRRILVVEDHRDIADSVKEILELEGYQVWTAGSGAAALRTLAQMGGADLILMDLKLPDMSGGELFTLLSRLAEFRTPVVAVTAGKDVPPHLAGVLAKPFELDDLLEMVRRHCGG